MRVGKKTADEARSFNEGWDTTVIYLSVTQTPFHHRPPGCPPSTGGESEVVESRTQSLEEGRDDGGAFFLLK